MRFEPFHRLALVTEDTPSASTSEYSAAMDASGANAVSVSAVATVLEGNPDDGGGGNFTNLDVSLQQSDDMQEWMTIVSSAINMLDPGAQILSSPVAIGYRYIRAAATLQNGSKDPVDSGARSVCSVAVVTSNI
jgi:hypothetical protein